MVRAGRHTPCRAVSWHLRLDVIVRSSCSTERPNSSGQALPQLEDGACRSHQPRNRLRWAGVEAPGVTRNREEYLDRTGLMRLDRNVSCPEWPGDSRGTRRSWASVGAAALDAFVIVMTDKRRTARCNT